MGDFRKTTLVIVSDEFTLDETQLKQPSAETLLAVYTRDTRTGDIQRAQILITVPEMLGILILSPALARNWTSRVKR